LHDETQALYESITAGARQARAAGKPPKKARKSSQPQRPKPTGTQLMKKPSTPASRAVTTAEMRKRAAQIRQTADELTKAADKLVRRSRDLTDRTVRPKKAGR
jgi:hypothetical protein